METHAESGDTLVPDTRILLLGSHLQTLMIYKLGFNQNYYTIALLLLIKIVLCSKFPWTKFINYKCFHMGSGDGDTRGERGCAGA